MDNGNLTTGGYVANAMYDNIRGFGYGYGYGGANPLPGSFARPEANAVRINRNNELDRERYRSTQFVLDQAEESRRFSELNNNLFQSELRNGDRLRDIEREMNANARTAADCCCDTQKELLKMQALNDKCCCETQKEILRLDANNNLKFAELSKQQAVDNGITQAKLAAIEAKIDANKEISELRAELETQKVLVGTNNGCGIGRVPCNPCVQS